MLVLISLLAIAAVGIYFYVTRNNDYWKKRNVPYIEPPFFFGNFLSMLIEGNLLPFVLRGFKKFSDYRYFGYWKLMQPGIIVQDPKLIELIQVNEFSSFHDNDFEIDEKTEPYFGKNPFVLKGGRWKTARNQVIQQFSPAKMKAMFPLMAKVSENFAEYLLTAPDAKGKDGMSAKEVCTRFTTDSVALCAFSVDARSFKEENPEMRAIGRKLFEPGLISNLKGFIIFLFPIVSKIFKIRLFPAEISDYFSKVIREVIQFRRETKTSANDFLDAMLKIQEKDKDFTEVNMVANVLTFYTDGYETSSIILHFILYELAANPDVYSKLRDEVDEIIGKNGGILTYDGIQEMKYLECVVLETLRLYPALRTIHKLCTKDFTLPNPKINGSGPGVLIEKGSSVVFSPWAVHRDAKYYPDPEKFDPDRFSAERRHLIDKATYMPFGLGPRTCLGQRFAQAQLKTAIATVVSKVDMKVNKKTIEPLEFDMQAFLTTVKGGIWLNFYKRQNL